MKILNTIFVAFLLANIAGCAALEPRSIYDNSGLSSGNSMGILEKDAPRCIESWANRNNYYVDVDNKCLAERYPACSGMGYEMDMKCIINIARPRQEAIEIAIKEDKARKEQQEKELAEKLRTDQIAYQNSPVGMSALKEAEALAEQAETECRFFLKDLERKTHFRAINTVLTKPLSEQSGTVICIYQGEMPGIYGNTLTQIEITGNARNKLYEYR